MKFDDGSLNVNKYRRYYSRSARSRQKTRSRVLQCIANLYERLLYSVTSGDSATGPETTETKLHEIFNYAVKWNVLLLKDETDVFLAERNLDSLSRNALVSGKALLAN